MKPGDVRMVRLKTTAQATVDIKAIVIKDRKAFGRIDWLVEPVEGAGQIWVQEAAFVDTKAAKS